MTSVRLSYLIGQGSGTGQELALGPEQLVAAEVWHQGAVHMALHQVPVATVEVSKSLGAVVAVAPRTGWSGSVPFLALELSDRRR